MKEKINRREFLYNILGSTALLITPKLFPSTEQLDNKTCYLYDEIYLKHKTGERHSEKPERLIAIENKVRLAEYYKKIVPIGGRKANIDIISLVHEPAYIEILKKESEEGRPWLSTGSADTAVSYGEDTPICKDSYDVALYAVGGVLSALDEVIKGKAKNAFCAIRPPGHHATPTRGMGFCLFNNVAIAARYAQKKHGIDRVLIADWDVHHGNGTQDTFFQDGSVFFMSTHQSPLYPRTGKREETGEERGKGYIMNRPFPKGAGNDEIIGAFKNDLLPAAKEFKPQLTLISAGFDSRKGDRLGGFQIDDNGFRELTKIMLEIAYIAGKGKLVSILEGGYNLEGMPLAVSAHIEELSKA